MAVYEINTFTIEKGADFDETIVIYNEDGNPLGIDSSFTGASKLRKHPKSETAYPFDLNFNLETSSVNISMASTVTSQLPFSGRCYFDLLLTYGSSETTTKKFAKGTIMVEDTASL